MPHYIGSAPKQAFFDWCHFYWWGPIRFWDFGCSVCKRVDFWWWTGAKGRILICGLCANWILKGVMPTSILLSCQSNEGWPPAHAGVLIDQSASKMVAVMGCQSFFFWDVQHMQLHGLAASVSEIRIRSMIYAIIWAVQEIQYNFWMK